MFDTTKELVIEGKVARFDWVNPHMYLIVETTGPDGKPALVEGEGVGITQALVDGLDRNALKVGTPVVVRVNPNRGGWGKQVRVMDVTTQDGEVHPFYAANRRTRVLTPAASLEGHWAPSRAAFGAAMGAMARWPVTPEGRAAQAAAADDGICSEDPPPVLGIFDELRAIELGDDEIVLQFDNTGDRSTRVVHMTAAHPADVQPSLHGHSIGRWEGETLVIETNGFTDRTAISGVRHSAALRLTERISRVDDLTLDYQVTIDDPETYTKPWTMVLQLTQPPGFQMFAYECHEGNLGLRNILSAERAEDSALADDLKKGIIRPRRPPQGGDSEN
jgi:hypothetical protein